MTNEALRRVSHRLILPTRSGATGPGDAQLHRHCGCGIVPRSCAGMTRLQFPIKMSQPDTICVFAFCLIDWLGS